MKTSWQIDAELRAAVDRWAREEWRRDVAANRADEDEHDRILNEGSPPIAGHALGTHEDERHRIAEDGGALAALQRHDRLVECGE